MADIPNTRFINHVDVPVTVTYSQNGSVQVVLDVQTGPVVDITGFRKFSVAIGTAKATSFEVFIGKISGSTLAQGFIQPIDTKVHIFDVVGPQMNLWLQGGPPNTTDNVKLWVYLTS